MTTIEFLNAESDKAFAKFVEEWKFLPEFKLVPLKFIELVFISGSKSGGNIAFEIIKGLQKGEIK